MIEHAVGYDAQTDQMTLFGGQPPEPLEARAASPRATRKRTAAAKQRRDPRISLRGVPRLAELRLLVAGSPAASSIEGMFNRLESERSVDTYTSDLAAYLRFARERLVQGRTAPESRPRPAEDGHVVTNEGGADFRVGLIRTSCPLG